MYLLDTNVWLERLLDQERSGEVGQFLEQVLSNQLFITDFAFHSIRVILTRLGRTEILSQFVQDLFIDGAVVLVRLQPQDTQRVIEAIDDFRFDFDDAYQYVAAEREDLIIISFDGDFDRTERGRRTPAEVLSN
jgi:predicted nucleic acid-binding protein